MLSHFSRSCSVLVQSIAVRWLNNAEHKSPSASLACLSPLPAIQVEVLLQHGADATVVSLQACISMPCAVLWRYRAAFVTSVRVRRPSFELGHFEAHPDSIAASEVLLDRRPCLGRHDDGKDSGHQSLQASPAFLHAFWVQCLCHFFVCLAGSSCGKVDCLGRVLRPTKSQRVLYV